MSRHQVHRTPPGDRQECGLTSALPSPLPFVLSAGMLIYNS